VTLAAAALPVRLPGGVHATITTAPVLAALFDAGLANPFGVCWVAFIGTFEPRDLRGEPRLYGTLFNRSNWIVSAYSAWLVLLLTRTAIRTTDPLGTIVEIVLAGGSFAIVNNSLSLLANSLKTGASLSRVWAVSVSKVAIGLLSQVPLGWLMAEIAVQVSQWAVVLFMVPLLLARYSFSKYTEVRELFFGSVSALSQAIDAKDGFTRGHADRVSRIAGAIARELGLPEIEVERIELAGLLHDIGKIGVPDAILRKPAKLTDEEWVRMREHPRHGQQILRGIKFLEGAARVVAQHHEKWNGSGYPLGLRAEEIDVCARIFAVADAFDAITSDRVYREGRSYEAAAQELDQWSNQQFDPKVVEAFHRVPKEDWDELRRRSVMREPNEAAWQPLARAIDSQLHAPSGAERLEFSL